MVMFESTLSTSLIKTLVACKVRFWTRLGEELASSLSTMVTKYVLVNELVAFRLMPLEPEFRKFEANWSFQAIDLDRRVVAFRDETTGKVTAWKWDFGDGSN